VQGKKDQVLKWNPYGVYPRGEQARL